MNPCFVRPALLAAVTAFVFAPGRAPAEEELGVQLYKKNVNSVVVIHAIEKKREGNVIHTSIGRGSGSLIDLKKRLVLTNWHVVEELDRVWVDFPIYLKDKDGTMFQDALKYRDRAMKREAISGKVLHRDKSRDLAIVQLDTVPSHARALPLARSSTRSGEPTWNIGSPGVVPQLFSITSGQVRTVGEGKFVVSGGEDSFEVRAKCVNATNPTNPGDSGGPLFDKRGYQVAVTQSGFGGSVQQVNSFIDVMEVRELLAEKKIEIEELTPAETGAVKVAVDPKAGTGTVVPKKEAPAVAGTASAEDEKKAGEMLGRAKRYSESEDQRTLYISKLKDVIKMYPGTKASKEAEKLLGSNK